MSLLKRRPIIDKSSSLNRLLAQATSSGDASILAPRFAAPGPSAIGIDGWESTGATTEGSVIMASA